MARHIVVDRDLHQAAAVLRTDRHTDHHTAVDLAAVLDILHTLAVDHELDLDTDPGLGLGLVLVIGIFSLPA